MIEVTAIYKNFGRHQVLKNVSFQIARGEVAGFLGANGAGKTTMMRILTTYLSPSKGSVVIGGVDARENMLAVRKKIGYLPETPPLYVSMTVMDYLKLAAELRGVPKEKVKQTIDWVLGQCQLEDVTAKRIGILSKGYKQRVGIAQAIIHKPEVLILDEPTNGLDPIQINQVHQLINALKEKTTVILSTHILSEIKSLTNRMLILKDGAIAFDGSVDHLEQAGNTLKNKFFELHEFHE